MQVCNLVLEYFENNSNARAFDLLLDMDITPKRNAFGRDFLYG